MAKPCPGCGTRDNAGHRCHVCGYRLGSLHKAVVAAGVAALGYGAIWVGLTWLTGMQLSAIATGFGAVVAGSVAIVSKGRGCLYQLIASGFTVIGIGVAQARVYQLLWDQLPGVPPDTPAPSIAALWPWVLQYDPVTVLWCVFGVLGGFILWLPTTGGIFLDE